uniref:Uncharacterized protein n=1 Tax=Utricularia reniformis TaxID=192314 RepID=A0A1Y0B0Y6_9LAMI|nr:hypothetical protein AEK19_MT0806 [Utricularia reniformis]ART31044.1 hypothetical protein AEK19_MT0806 [Utricularia reniformis]
MTACCFLLDPTTHRNHSQSGPLSVIKWKLGSSLYKRIMKVTSYVTMCPCPALTALINGECDLLNPPPTLAEKHPRYTSPFPCAQKPAL